MAYYCICFVFSGGLPHMLLCMWFAAGLTSTKKGKTCTVTNYTWPNRDYLPNHWSCRWYFYFCRFGKSAESVGGRHQFSIWKFLVAWPNRQNGQMGLGVGAWLNSHATHWIPTTHRLRFQSFVACGCQAWHRTGWWQFEINMSRTFRFLNFDVHLITKNFRYQKWRYWTL